MDVGTLIQIGGPLLAIGGAWGGAKMALNGTRERVYRMERQFREHEFADEMLQRETIDRLARIEVKLELILGGQRNEQSN